MQKFMYRTSCAEIHAQNFMFGIGQTALPDPFYLFLPRCFHFAPSTSHLLPRCFYLAASTSQPLPLSFCLAPSTSGAVL